ncbi:hypothetical protein H8S37_04315 [Mediterraneibacter sp. NSJ-55]|uniref:DUF6273 domain-containing protein n=1 Tax=Mediterraneibacter hominis TaxID=2763054 RepID=A0A923RR92_9FIRM|nr:DUF6273 domain-containing protein [Mediterraneibacter hominis]MBC5688157.1 hypothetical protein [Mediterraneibacter hominis]
MKNNVSVINNTGKDIIVIVNKINGSMQIRIDEGGKLVRLFTLKPGNVFRDSDGVEYIVCEHFINDTTAVVTKKLLEKKWEFGLTNNWGNSYIRAYFNGEYFKELENKFGTESIIGHEVDLLSMDGYDDYGTCVDKVSLMTFDQYRKYSKIIGKVDSWWWLATPNQTPSRNDSSYVRFVCSDGGVSCNGCGYDGGGVRPFFILPSSIFVFPDAE